MKGLVAVLASVFLAVAAGLPNSLSKCASSLNEKNIMEIVETCAFKELESGNNWKLIGSLMDEKKRNEMLSDPTDFVCEHPKLTADLFLCVVKKVMNCMPEVKSMAEKLLPESSNIANGVSVACHNKQFLRNECLKSDYTKYLQCVGSQSMALGMQLGQTLIKNRDQTLCTLLQVQENCLAENSGSCSKSYVKTFDDVLEAIYPMHNCKKASQSFGKLANSVLIRGQPNSLIFKPQRNSVYKFTKN